MNLSIYDVAGELKTRLKEDSDIELTRDVVVKILQEEQDFILECIAVQDMVSYKWGTIGGTEKPPAKITGSFSKHEVIKNNYGYSWFKKGVPYVQWSKDAKVSTTVDPKEYFYDSDHKYSTAARKYRKDIGAPELPEFEGLSEEKILEICHKADIKELERMPKNKRINKVKNDIKNKAMIEGLHKVWAERDYVPLGSYDYQGKQRDVVGTQIIQFFHNNKIANNILDVREQLDLFRYIKDYAELDGTLDQHPELAQIEQAYLERLEKDGVKPKTHEDKYDNYEQRSTEEKLKWLLDYPFEEDGLDAKIKNTKILYTRELCEKDYVKEARKHLGLDTTDTEAD